jgi:hypothetical protein
MPNKSMTGALVAALLAGCSSSNVTPPLGPMYLSNIAQVPVRGVTGKRVVVLSVLGSLTINGVVHKEIVNGNCTLYHKRPRLAVGCHVVSALNARVASSSYSFFTGTSGTGCDAATGNYRGRIFRGSSIPILFRWSGRC